MKRLFLGLCMIMASSYVQAGIFNAVSDIENNSETSYIGGWRTINPHNHSYTVNPLGLPITIKPKLEKDADKPSFYIEQVSNEGARSCPWFYMERTYKVTGSNGYTTTQPLCAQILTRSNIYVKINADYTISLESTYTSNVRGSLGGNQ